MADTDLDAATLANYRREIERATASDERARGATAAVFAALDRRDAREREMLEIVRAVASAIVWVHGVPPSIDVPMLYSVFDDMWEMHDRARALLGGGK